MIEDRLMSMIYHMGFLANRNKLSVWKKVRPFIENCVAQYNTQNEDCTLGVKSLTGKIKIVRSVYNWAANSDDAYDTDTFAFVLKSQLESTDIGAVLEALDDIDKWKKCRNEIVHAMMNKNLDSLESYLQPQAIEGMRLARALDAQECLLKKGNIIRRKMNLPMK